MPILQTVTRFAMKRIMLALIHLSVITGAGAQGFDMRAMESFAARLFDEIDLNNDGSLSPEEYKETDGGGFPVEYRLLDLNADGIVTKSEYLLAVRKYHPPSEQRQPI